MSASDPVLALPPILLFLTSMFASRLAKSSLAPLQSALSRLVLAVPPPSSSQAGGAAQKLTRSFTSSPASMAGIIRDVSATTFAAEVKEAEPDSFVVVDVREPWELELARLRTIPHVNLPMSKLGSAEGAEAVEALDKSKPIYVMCHHGVRSRRVAEYLYGMDRFDELVNVAGGIAAFAAEVDPKTGEY